MRASTTEVDKIVEELFCGTQARYGDYAIDDLARQTSVRGEELIKGLLYRYRLRSAPPVSEPIALYLYRDVGPLTGVLWEQNVRALHRLGGLRHPSLPEMIDGRYDEEHEIAFIRTREPLLGLDQLAACEYYAERPSSALRSLSQLVDALDHVHGNRLSHRNLTPLSLAEGEPAEGDDEPTLVLTRFEMSAMTSNLARGNTVDTAATAKDIRDMLLAGDTDGQLHRHVAYFPPERHGFLFGGDLCEQNEFDTSDVFGLGMLAFEWFCGPMEQVLASELTAVLRPGAATASGLTDLHRAARRHLSQRTDLPLELVRILGDMLDPDPTGRPTASMVCNRLADHWISMIGHWEDETRDAPLLVAYMVEEAHKTVWRRFHWITNDPRTPEGQAEYGEWLAKELSSPTLVYTEHGAQPFIDADSAGGNFSAANWVLIGDQGVWFCDFLRLQESGFRRGYGREVDDVLLVKFVQAKRFALPLLSVQPKRTVGRIDLVSWRRGDDLVAERQGRPSWRSLTSAVKMGRTADLAELGFLDAIEWLIQFQRTLSDAREYPFVVDPDGPLNGPARLIYDDQRDKQRHYDNPMLSKMNSNDQILPFGDFFDTEMRQRDLTILEYCGDRYGRPDRSNRRQAEYLTWIDKEAIEVRSFRHMPIPTKGWVRVADEGSQWSALNRQFDAKQLLATMPALIRQLVRPQSVPLTRTHRDAEFDLEGRAPDIIREMLTYEPFYALQGPPGTGKTTICTHAVSTHLAADRTSRILISAQSNHALDNLAAKVLREVDDSVLALRVSSEHRMDKVSPELKAHTIESLGRSTIDGLIGRATARLEDERDENRRAILDEWRATVQDSGLELTERIRRGANLVFATCAMASPTDDEAREMTPSYDWVIIEEAAKAWPTELIIPLTRANRWTLIGDHKQLPAHGRKEVVAFLRGCYQDDDPQIAAYGEKADDFIEVFDLFKHLFDDDDGPNGFLDMQFRMRPAICQLVSRAFYQLGGPATNDGQRAALPTGLLKTHATADKPVDLVAPRYLTPETLPSGLIWIDTVGHPECEDEYRWLNPGEAALVATIVASLRPSPPPAGSPAAGERLAVLTPYLQQVDYLSRFAVLKDRVHTVHSFQGREADIVIVSLVRDTRRREDDWLANVGHVGESEVANVLLSRARKLMVLVGRFEHFLNNGGPEWQVVCQAVREYGIIVPAVELFGVTP